MLLRTSYWWIIVRECRVIASTSLAAQSASRRQHQRFAQTAASVPEKRAYLDGPAQVASSICPPPALRGTTNPQPFESAPVWQPLRCCTSLAPTLRYLILTVGAWPLKSGELDEPSQIHEIGRRRCRRISRGGRVAQYRHCASKDLQLEDDQCLVANGKYRACAGQWQPLAVAKRIQPRGSIEQSCQVTYC